MSDDAVRRARAQVATQQGSMDGANYADSVQQSIDACSRLLNEVAGRYRDNTLPSLKGFLAEAFHVGTFNVDATRQGLEGVHASLIGDNGAIDLVVQTGSDSSPYQVKYWKSAADTAKEASHPQYDGMGKIGPSDQIADAREEALRRATRIEGHRPEQAAHLRHTAEHISGRIDAGGAHSRALSHEESMRLAREGRHGTVDVRDHGVTIDKMVEPLDVAREAAAAGVSAMALSAALAAAPHIIDSLRKAYNGDPARARAALETAAREGVQGAGAGFIRGAVAAGVQIACRTGALGEAARAATPGIVGASTAVVLRALVDAYKLSQGQITAVQFADRTAGGCAAGMAGMYGAAAGQVLIPIPVVGALVGSFVGSTLGSLGYDGIKQGIRRAENREGWEAQVTLATQIAALGNALQVTTEGAIVLITAQDHLARSLVASAQEWQGRSAQMRSALAEVEARHNKFDDRQLEINRRLAALQARSRLTRSE
ncbi:MAG: hypothetical protein Q8Q09_18155 [Deltaproteobacteria bacterium]|nr:hypothetical protein [Deltaproteobacteria bacterium]